MHKRIHEYSYFYIFKFTILQSYLLKLKFYFFLKWPKNDKKNTDCLSSKKFYSLNKLFFKMKYKVLIRFII